MSLNVLRICCLGIALLAGPALARVEVQHPYPKSFDPNIASALEQAQSAFRSADPDDSDTWGTLAMVYHAHSLLVPARQAYENAHELTAGDGRWAYYLGLIAAEEGRFADAIGWFELSQDANPYYVPTKIRMTRARIQLGQREQAQGDLEQFVARYPDVAAFHADLAQLLRGAGRHQEAVKHFETALELQPDASALRYPLALAYRDLKQMEQARVHIQQRGEKEVVIEDPLNARMRGASRSYTYFLTLAVQSADNGQFDQALRHIQSALEIAPDNVYVIQTQARILEAAGNLPAATAQVERALALEPEFALALEHRGVLHELDGDDLSAEIFYDRAVQNDPNLYEARVLLANVLMRTRRYDKAAAQYQALLERHPERVELLLRLAAAEYEAERCERAVGTLRSLMAKTPSNPGHFMAYARVVATCQGASEKDRGNALAGMMELYRLDPSLHVTTTLAMVEASHRNFAAAADLQAQALFMMVRDGRGEETEALRETLEGYRNEQPATRAWSRDNPIASPPRVRVEDRQ